MVSSSKLSPREKGAIVQVKPERGASYRLISHTEQDPRTALGSFTGMQLAGTERTCTTLYRIKWPPPKLVYQPTFGINGNKKETAICRHWNWFAHTHYLLA